jgi:hypothetical protein
VLAFIRYRIAFGLFGKAEEYEQCAIESDEICIGQPAQAIADICPRDRRDLVDHDVARLLNSGSGRWLHRDSGQWSLDRIGGQWTDRDCGRGVEPIVLNDDDRSWLTGVSTARGRDVNIASPHSVDCPSAASQSTETASTNAWSSGSCSLAAMAAD